MFLHFFLLFVVVVITNIFFISTAHAQQIGFPGSASYSCDPDTTLVIDSSVHTNSSHTLSVTAFGPRCNLVIRDVGAPFISFSTGGSDNNNNNITIERFTCTNDIGFSNGVYRKSPFCIYFAQKEIFKNYGFLKIIDCKWRVGFKKYQFENSGGEEVRDGFMYGQLLAFTAFDGGIENIDHFEITGNEFDLNLTSTVAAKDVFILLWRTDAGSPATAIGFGLVKNFTVADNRIDLQARFATSASVNVIGFSTGNMVLGSGGLTVAGNRFIVNSLTASKSSIVKLYWYMPYIDLNGLSSPQQQQNVAVLSFLRNQLLISNLTAAKAVTAGALYFQRQMNDIAALFINSNTFLCEGCTAVAGRLQLFGVAHFTGTVWPSGADEVTFNDNTVTHRNIQGGDYVFLYAMRKEFGTLEKVAKVSLSRNSYLVDGVVGKSISKKMYIYFLRFSGLGEIGTFEMDGGGANGGGGGGGDNENNENSNNNAVIIQIKNVKVNAALRIALLDILQPVSNVKKISIRNFVVNVTNIEGDPFSEAEFMLLYPHRPVSAIESFAIENISVSVSRMSSAYYTVGIYNVYFGDALSSVTSMRLARMMVSLDAITYGSAASSFSPLLVRFDTVSNSTLSVSDSLMRLAPLLSRAKVQATLVDLNMGGSGINVLVENVSFVWWSASPSFLSSSSSSSSSAACMPADRAASTAVSVLSVSSKSTQLNLSNSISARNCHVTMSSRVRTTKLFVSIFSFFTAVKTDTSSSSSSSSSAAALIAAESCSLTVGQQIESDCFDVHGSVRLQIVEFQDAVTGRLAVRVDNCTTQRTSVTTTSVSAALGVEGVMQRLVTFTTLVRLSGGDGSGIFISNSAVVDVPGAAATRNNENFYTKSATSELALLIVYPYNSAHVDAGIVDRANVVIVNNTIAQRRFEVQVKVGTTLGRATAILFYCYYSFQNSNKVLIERNSIELVDITAPLVPLNATASSLMASIILWASLVRFSADCDASTLVVRSSSISIRHCVSARQGAAEVKAVLFSKRIADGALENVSLTVENISVRLLSSQPNALDVATLTNNGKQQLPDRIESNAAYGLVGLHIAAAVENWHISLQGVVIHVDLSSSSKLFSSLALLYQLDMRIVNAASGVVASDATIADSSVFVTNYDSLPARGLISSDAVVELSFWKPAQQLELSRGGAAAASRLVFRNIKFEIHDHVRAGSFDVTGFARPLIHHRQEQRMQVIENVLLSMRDVVFFSKFSFRGFLAKYRLPAVVLETGSGNDEIEYEFTSVVMLVENCRQAASSSSSSPAASPPPPPYVGIFGVELALWQFAATAFEVAVATAASRLLRVSIRNISLSISSQQQQQQQNNNLLCSASANCSMFFIGADFLFSAKQVELRNNSLLISDQPSQNEELSSSSSSSSFVSLQMPNALQYANSTFFLEENRMLPLAGASERNQIVNVSSSSFIYSLNGTDWTFGCNNDGWKTKYVRGALKKGPDAVPSLAQLRQQQQQQQPPSSSSSSFSQIFKQTAGRVLLGCSASASATRTDPPSLSRSLTPSPTSTRPPTLSRTGATLSDSSVLATESAVSDSITASPSRSARTRSPPRTVSGRSPTQSESASAPHRTVLGLGALVVTFTAASQAASAVAALGAGTPVAAMSISRAVTAVGLVGCPEHNEDGQRWVDAEPDLFFTLLPVPLGSNPGQYWRSAVLGFVLVGMALPLVLSCFLRRSPVDSSVTLPVLGRAPHWMFLLSAPVLGSWASAAGMLAGAEPRAGVYVDAASQSSGFDGWLAILPLVLLSLVVFVVAVKIYQSVVCAHDIPLAEMDDGDGGVGATRTNHLNNNNNINNNSNAMNGNNTNLESFLSEQHQARRNATAATMQLRSARFEYRTVPSMLLRNKRRQQARDEQHDDEQQQQQHQEVEFQPRSARSIMAERLLRSEFGRYCLVGEDTWCRDDAVARALAKEAEGNNLSQQRNQQTQNQSNENDDSASRQRRRHRSHKKPLPANTDITATCTKFFADLRGPRQSVTWLGESSEYDATFTQRYSPLYNVGCFCATLAVCFVQGFSKSKGNPTGLCRLALMLNVVFSSAIAVATVVLRPFLVPIKNWIAGFLEIIVAVGAILILVGETQTMNSTRSDASFSPEKNAIVLASEVLLFLGGGIALFLFLLLRVARIVLLGVAQVSLINAVAYFKLFDGNNNSNNQNNNENNQNNEDGENGENVDEAAAMTPRRIVRRVRRIIRRRAPSSLVAPSAVGDDDDDTDAALLFGGGGEEAEVEMEDFAQSHRGGDRDRDRGGDDELI